MADTPDLDGATTYRETARPDSAERWHVLAGGSVWFERRPREFEPARILTAETLARREAWRVAD